MVAELLTRGSLGGARALAAICRGPFLGHFRSATALTSLDIYAILPRILAVAELFPISVLVGNTPPRSAFIVVYRAIF